MRPHFHKEGSSSVYRSFYINPDNLIGGSAGQPVDGG